MDGAERRPPELKDHPALIVLYKKDLIWLALGAWLGAIVYGFMHLPPERPDRTRSPWVAELLAG